MQQSRNQRQPDHRTGPKANHLVLVTASGLAQRAAPVTIGFQSLASELNGPSGQDGVNGMQKLLNDAHVNLKDGWHRWKDATQGVLRLCQQFPIKGRCCLNLHFQPLNFEFIHDGFPF